MAPTCVVNRHLRMGRFTHAPHCGRAYRRGVTIQPCRVVVVDDHALLRDGTRTIIDEQQDLCVVGEADNVDRALALINQLNPDVVLMDVRLPGLNGIEGTRRIARQHPLVRVLIVSAYDDEEYVRGALEAGAAGYLSKAAPGRELVDAIRAVAHGSVVLGPSGIDALLTRPEDSHRGLTQRELDVLQLLADGLHNREIAERLHISPRTVDRHCDAIYSKLQVTSRTEAVVHAIAADLVRLPKEQT